MPRIMRCMPPPFIFFIIFCICLCCLSRRLRSGTPVPDPAVMRRLRDGLMRSGFLRSLGVMELIIASIRSNCFVSNCDCAACAMPPMPGILSSMAPMPPIFFICWSWSRKSSRSKRPPFSTFFARRWAFFLSTFRSASSMSESKSPIPKIREARRSG